VNSKHFLWLLLLIPAIALMGCEGDTGPAGPAGADGTDGTDGTDGANGNSLASCLECHTDAATLQIGMEYVMSHHKQGLYVGYAGGRASCARCHSKQGFIEYAVTGDVAGDVVDPAAIDCATCHEVHPATFALRLTDPVSMIWDETYMLDFGDNSNNCANCHQSRRAEPNISNPGETFEITSTHYGPHHGAMANVLEGVGFAEIAGSTAYPAPSDGSGHLSVGMTCVSCHMATYEDGTGGHTWWPALNSCQSCHSGTTDFDVNGFQTATQAKLLALRDRLIELGVVEYVEEDEAYEPVLGTYPMAQAQAFFNWIGLTEDRSLGVHNPRYYTALLDNSLEAIADDTK
jgi:hypothetical protein